VTVVAGHSRLDLGLRRSASVTQDRPAGVRLLDVEPDLVIGVSTDDFAALRRSLIVPAVSIPVGRWTGQASIAQAVSILVVRGMLICDDSSSLGIPAVQLFGPGDLIDARLLTKGGTELEALTPAQVAVLDDRMLLAARRCPELALGLTRRLFDGQHERHVAASIRGLAHTEDRIFSYLWHVASRWGRVTPAGLALTLPVTHDQLGRLIAARRPTVSLALAALNQRGALTKLDDGRWLIRRVSHLRSVDSQPESPNPTASLRRREA
jgi:hypothetical protein